MKRNLFKPSTWFASEPVAKAKRYDPSASATFRYLDHVAVPFDGEKDQGMAGPKINYLPEHYSLNTRAWQALLESDVAAIAIYRKINWVIGRGLKLQAEPIIDIIEEEGVKFNKKKFTKQFERRFNVLRRQTSWDYAGKKNLNQLSREAFKNAMLGGDVLVVLRVKKDRIKIQLIDGYDVQSPYYGSEWYPKELPDGHLLIDGVEIDNQRQPVAYWVKVWALDATLQNFNSSYKFERVEAKAKNGAVMAYLYYGNTHRINNVRGLPVLAACHQKLNNMSQYSDATLKQANASAKVDYVQENELGSSGTAVWAKQAVQSMNGTLENGPNPVTDDGVEKNNRVIPAHFGLLYNVEPGGKIKVLENKNPLYFKEFMSTHSDIFFAVIGIPPNVAMAKYDDSFSASRMATGDWQNQLLNDREDHYVGFFKPIIDMWLELQIIYGRVSAPGYMAAKKGNDEALLASYQNVRLLGANVPAVDSLKEAEAARIVLGDAAAHIPLNDVHSVTEQLGNGDSFENIERFGEELKTVKAAGIEQPAIIQQVNKQGAKKPGTPKPGRKSKKGD